MYHLYFCSFVSPIYTLCTPGAGVWAGKVVLSAGLTLSTTRYMSNISIIPFYQYINYLRHRFHGHRYTSLSHHFLVSAQFAQDKILSLTQQHSRVTMYLPRVLHVTCALKQSAGNFGPLRCVGTLTQALGIVNVDIIYLEDPKNWFKKST